MIERRYRHVVICDVEPGVNLVVFCVFMGVVASSGLQRRSLVDRIVCRIVFWQSLGLERSCQVPSLAGDSGYQDRARFQG